MAKNKKQRRVVLETAIGYVDGVRSGAYGEPKKNFEDIAGLWNIQFQHKLSEPLTASDVAQAMVHVKQARLIKDDTKEDTWTDIAGYAACGAEAAGAK